MAGRPAGQQAPFHRHLSRAVAENGDFAALQTRTRFDLARALIRQRAGKLGMVNLAVQAAAELDHSPGGER